MIHNALSRILEMMKLLRVTHIVILFNTCILLPYSSSALATSENAEIQISQQEIEINGRQYLRKDGRIYQRSNGQDYEVIANSLSLKFKQSITDQDRMKFLKKHNLTVIRKNKLGVFDVELPAGADILNILCKLKEETELDFIEVNTRGAYQGE